MRAGVLGVVDGDFRKVDSFTDTVDEDGHELTRALDIQRVFSLPDGEMAFAGRAAREYVRERAAPEIGFGEVTVTEEVATGTRHTEFVGIPGEFVVVGSGRGTFAFDLVGLDTGASVERATIDLDALYDRRGDALTWKAGFFGGDDGVTGVLHGSDLRGNHDLDAMLDGARLNQLGLEYTYDGDDLKMTASRSGYVEVYQPSSFDSVAYLEYLRSEVVPHLEEE